MDTFIRMCGLIFGCPYGLDENTCPFFELRKKSKYERYLLFKNMSLEEMKLVEEKHRACFENESNKRKVLTNH
jgi:hypothetical protein